MADYATERSKIKSGDMLLWSHRSIESFYDLKVIGVRIFTMSKYCHTGTAHVWKDRVWVIESVIPRIQHVPLSNFLPVDWAPMDAPWTEKTEDFAISLIGKKEEGYSQIEAMRAPFHKADPFRPGRWFCSKLTWRLGESDGIVMGSTLTPSALGDWAMAHSSLRTLEGEVNGA